MASDTLLHEQLPTWSWSRPAGGLFLWIRLPEGDAGEFSQLALRYGVRVAPGEMMSVDQSHTNYLRLSFFFEPPKLEEAVRRLARAWANYPRLSRATSAQIEVMV